jgi:hypothetical protein
MPMRLVDAGLRRIFEDARHYQSIRCVLSRPAQTDAESLLGWSLPGSEQTAA